MKKQYKNHNYEPVYFQDNKHRTEFYFTGEYKSRNNIAKAKRKKKLKQRKK